MTTTLLDKVRYEIWFHSNCIHELKKQAHELQPVTRETWVKAGVTLDKFEPGAKMKLETVEHTILTLNPKHRLWPEYRRLKGVVTSLLGARAIIRDYGRAPDFNTLDLTDLRPSTVPPALMRNHAPKRKRKRLVRKALKTLREIDKAKYGPELEKFVLDCRKWQAARLEREHAMAAHP